MSDDAESFERLRDALAAGEPWAWTKVHREHAANLANYLAAAGMDDPDKGVGEVLVHFARQVGRYAGGPESFRAALFGVARRYVNSDPTLAVRAVANLTPNLAGSAHVRAVLDHLGDDDREVLLLRVGGGLDVDETATVLGVDPAWVVRAQRHAVETLREMVF